MQGIKEWTNEKNGFKVLEIHYKADPVKRTPEWYARTRPGYSQTAWDQEQDIVFTTRSGKGIYRKEFSYLPTDEGGNVVHNIELNPQMPIYRIWDFGYHYPAVLFIQETLPGHHVAFDELMGCDIWLQNFVPQVQEKTDSYKGQYSGFIRDMCDPAGKAAKSTGLSDLEVLLSNGIRPSYRQFEIKPTIDYVRNALCIRRDDGYPILLIDSDRCPILCEGFNGGYRYPKKKYSEKGESELPLEDGYYEHLHDCMRYYAGHRMRIVVRNRREASDGASKIVGNPSSVESRNSEIYHPRFGRSQRQNSEEKSRLDGAHRYPAELTFDPEVRQAEVVGGVQRRQIAIRSGYGGPTYSKRPR